MERWTREPVCPRGGHGTDRTRRRPKEDRPPAGDQDVRPEGDYGEEVHCEEIHPEGDYGEEVHCEEIRGEGDHGEEFFAEEIVRR